MESLLRVYSNPTKDLIAPFAPIIRHIIPKFPLKLGTTQVMDELHPIVESTVSDHDDGNLQRRSLPPVDLTDYNFGWLETEDQLLKVFMAFHEKWHNEKDVEATYPFSVRMGWTIVRRRRLLQDCFQHL